MASWTITCACLYITYTHGIRSVAILFWFKIITLGLIFYFINNYKRHEFYYYKNIGATKATLWAPTMAFDIMLFLSSTLLTLKFR